jgi:peptidyl-prolyl cis-trans isomerase C
MKCASEQLAVFAMCSVCAVGLGQIPPASQPAGAPTSAPTSAVAGDVAATVNGHAISASEIDKLVWERTPQKVLESRQAGAAVAQQRARYLDMAIDDWLLDEQVRGAGIRITDEDMAQSVGEELAAYLSNYGTTRDDFDSVLRSQRNQSLQQFLTERQHEPMQRAALGRRRLMEKLVPDTLRVSDDEIQAYYDKYREQRYTLPERRRISQIMVSTRGMTPEEKATARQKAERFLEEARRPEADFAALAARYSDCPSKAKGGDLGFSARRGGLAEPLAAAAFALEVGQVSDVVDSGEAYHILKVTAKAEPRTMSLEEARLGILQTLRDRKLRAELKRYAAELRAKADIVYSPGWAPLPRMSAVPATPMLTSPAVPDSQPGTPPK